MQLAAFPQAPLAPRPRIAVYRLFGRLARERHEVAAFAYLAEDGRMLGARHARSHVADRVDLPVRAVTTDALAFGAVSVMMAHNHPSGIARPSTADIAATRRLSRALDLFDIRLLDHVIVTRRDSVSLAVMGLM